MKVRLIEHVESPRTQSGPSLDPGAGSGLGLDWVLVRVLKVFSKSGPSPKLLGSTGSSGYLINLQCVTQMYYSYISNLIHS
jgi:hypothetical protein